MRTSPSGEQWTIQHGDHEAVVVEVGGGLRTYTVGGVDIVAGYAADQVCRSGRGQVLVPWPNRIRDGRYDFDGVSHQVPLTEPALGNANHGLVRWSTWTVLAREEAAVTVGTRLFPQPGWDGRLDVAVRYALSDSGLGVTPTVTNVGDTRVPFGYGAHPYVAIGETPAADVVLTVPAAREIRVDDRMLPLATEPVRPEVDFREARPVGDTSLDTAYTGLDRQADGAWVVSLSGLGQGHGVDVWGDAAFGWLQVFTGQAGTTGLTGPRGIAVEPMTCPADAFNSGEGLTVLEPGDSWTGSWGVRPRSLS